MHYLISYMVFLPILGTGLQIFLNRLEARWFALATSLLSSICAFTIFFKMKSNITHVQFVERFKWMHFLSIDYAMGVDGLNILLVLLIALVFPLMIAKEWHQKLNTQGFFSLILLLQGSLAGCVCASDLFLQFFFWSLTTIPIYFLSAIWGHQDRGKSAFRALISNLLGNACIFAALILIFCSIAPQSFSLEALSESRFSTQILDFGIFQVSLSWLVFFLVCLGFSLRVPIWPLHGWYVHLGRTAPMSVFIILSAVFVPITVNIFIRYCYSLFPALIQQAGYSINIVGAINLIVGAACAISQTKLKGLFSFLTLSQVGLMLVGVSSLSIAGMMGAILQQLMAGLILSANGLIFGLIHDRIGHDTYQTFDKNTRTLGGLLTKAPVLGTIAALTLSATLGLPGMGSFFSHTLILFGCYLQHPMSVGIAFICLILSMYYLFYMFKKVFLGPSLPGMIPFEDLNMREKSYLLPFVFSFIVFGIYPTLLTETIRPTLLNFILKLHL